MCGLASGILKFLKENEPPGTASHRRSASHGRRSAWWRGSRPGHWPPQAVRLVPWAVSLVAPVATRTPGGQVTSPNRHYLFPEHFHHLFHSIHHLLCFLMSIFEFYRLQVRPQRCPTFTFDVRDDRRRSG